MIFVSLGSQKFQFNRLLKAIDDLIAQGKLEDSVFAQVGYSDYQPRHYEYQPFLDADAFNRALGEAEVIITHAGTGVIINAVKKGKKVIVAPRLARYGEHVDDHQVQIAEMFSSLGFILACEDCGQLADKIEEVKTLHFQPYVSNTAAIIDSLEAFISKI